MLINDQVELQSDSKVVRILLISRNFRFILLWASRCLTKITVHTFSKIYNKKKKKKKKTHIADDGYD